MAETTAALLFGLAFAVFGMARWRGGVAVGRAATAALLGLALLVLALAPTWSPVALGRPHQVRVVLIDVSRSVGADVADLLRRDDWGDSAATRWLIVAFGERALVLHDGPLAGVPSPFPVSPSLTDPVMRRTARLVEGLIAVRGALEPGDVADLLVLTDGGIDVDRVRAHLAATDLACARVEVRMPARAGGEELGVRFVTEPMVVGESAGFDVELEVSGRLREPADVRVSVTPGSSPIVVRLGPNLPSTRLRVPVPPVGSRARVDAEVSLASGRLPPARAELPLHVRRARPRVLVVLGAGANPPPEFAGADVEVVGASSALADVALGAGDLVVLADLARDDPGARQLEARLVHHVGSGGGLLITGAMRAFGLGAWADTALDQLAPLRSRPGGAPRHVTVCLDRSGSMARGGRYRIACRAAEALYRELGADDRLRVIAFGADVHDWSWSGGGPATPVAAALASLRPEGGTDVAAALDRAVAEPVPPGATAIVLLLTDGRDARSLTAPHIAAWRSRLEAEGRTLFILWYDADDALEPRLRELVGRDGRLVRVAADGDVVQPFLTAARGGLILAPAPVTRADGTRVTLPRLLRTRTASGAQILAAHDDVTPALAVVERGPGRVAAAPLTLDAAGIEALFGGAAGFGDFWSRLIRPSDGGEGAIDLEERAGRWRFVVTGDPGAAWTLTHAGRRWLLRAIRGDQRATPWLVEPPRAGLVELRDAASDALLAVRGVAGATLDDRLPVASAESRAGLRAALAATESRRASGAPGLLLALVAFAALVADLALRIARR